jgi:hypothetical protein
MAKKYWPKEDPIGQVITIGKGLGPQFNDAPRQIVGIVGDVRETGLADTNVGVMYIPQSQVPDTLRSHDAHILVADVLSDEVGTVRRSPSGPSRHSYPDSPSP